MLIKMQDLNLTNWATDLWQPHMIGTDVDTDQLGVWSLHPNSYLDVGLANPKTVGTQAAYSPLNFQDYHAGAKALDFRSAVSRIAGLSVVSLPMGTWVGRKTVELDVNLSNSPTPTPPPPPKLIDRGLTWEREADGATISCAGKPPLKFTKDARVVISNLARVDAADGFGHVAHYYDLIVDSEKIMDRITLSNPDADYPIWDCVPNAKLS
jgi:hypothetical protein